MKIELKESFKFEQGEIPKGEIVLIKTVINNEKNGLPALYNGTWNDLPVSIPSHKCFEIYEKETDPIKLKKLDDWFDKTTNEFIETEKNYTEILKEDAKKAMKKVAWEAWLASAVREKTVLEHDGLKRVFEDWWNEKI